MGLFYIAAFRNVALSANGDASQNLFELVNGATLGLKIHEIQLTSQYDVDERVDLQLYTMSANSGSGTGVTPKPLDPHNNIASTVSSFKYMATVPGTLANPLHAWQWSQLAPLGYLPTPETRISVPPSGQLCLNNQNFYVASTRYINGYVIWEEGA